MGGRASQGPGPGEVVVWSGHPGHQWAITPLDAYGLLVGGMAAVIGFGLVHQGRYLWLSIPLLLAGLALSVVRYVVDRWRRRHTSYVLTLDHAFITTEGLRTHTTVVDLRRVGPSRVYRHLDGSDTIAFGPLPSRVGFWEPMRWRRAAFHFITDADALMPVIRGESDEYGAAPAPPRRPAPSARMKPRSVEGRE
jgi:hypothetical protein